MQVEKLIVAITDCIRHNLHDYAKKTRGGYYEVSFNNESEPYVGLTKDIMEGKKTILGAIKEIDEYPFKMS